MALKDYHINGEAANDGGDTTNTVWKAQTFVPLSSYTATSIVLRVFRAAGTGGTITVSLRATSGGLPTGGDLASGTIDITTLDASTPGQWHTVTLSAGVALTANTRYAIVYRRDGSAGNVYFRVSTATVYAFGQYCSSSDSGSSWALPGSPNTNDVVFKVYDSSSYTPQLLYTAGTVATAKNVWSITDDGETLTLLNSFSLGANGDITAMTYEKASDKLYVADNGVVYRYTASTMTLDTSWGSSGTVTVGALVNDLAVDTSNFLAVAHNLANGGRFSLYGSDGVLDWTSTVFGGGNGYRVAFDAAGNVAGGVQGAGSTSKVAALVSRTDGTLLATYLQGPGVAGYHCDGIVSHPSSAGYVWYANGYSTTVNISYSNSTPDDWTKGFTGTPRDVVLLSGSELVFVAASQALRGYNPTDGEAHLSADYHPIVGASIGAGTLAKLSKNDSLEFYACGDTGIIAVGNYSASARSTLTVTSSALVGIGWAGDYSSPITATISGTGSISTAALTYTAWRRILTEYMPTYEGNIKNFIVNDLTASRLAASDANKKLASVATLSSWVAGTANEVNVADDGDGTITIGLVDPLIVGKGGIGVATLTDHGLLLGSGTDAITPLGAATNGQLPIGSTGVDPVLATLTQGAGITVTNGAGSVTIATTITQYTDALARAAISETVTGLDYNNTTGVFSLTSGYVVPTTTQETNWSTAFTHVTSTGDDHTWLNQDMTTGASPVFAGLELKESIVTIDSYTKLLLHFDGADASTTLGDNSFSAHVPAVVAHAQIDTAQSKFGGSSCVFDGTDDYVTIPASADFNWGSSDFTVDFWFYITNTGRKTFCAFDTNTRFEIDYNGAGTTKLGLWASSNGTGWDLINADPAGNGICASTPPLNQWNHVAVVRNGNNWQVYLNGISDLNITVAGTFVDNSGQAFNLGRSGYAVNHFWYTGWIDEFRISKGVARWTAAFTPPVKPYGCGTYGRLKVGYEEVSGDNAGLVVKDWFGLGTNAPKRKLHLYDAAGSAEFLMERGDQTADQKRFNIFISGNKTNFRALNDAGDGGSTWLYCSHATGEITLNYPLVCEDSLFITEKAADLADRAGKGQIWVKNTTPNELWFTDDAGGATKVNNLTYAEISANDAGTDITAAEMEDLTDGGATTLHSHAGGAVGGRRISAYCSSSQSVNTTTWTRVQYDTEVYDKLGEFDNATNYRFTASVAGYYHFAAYVTMVLGATGNGLIIRVRYNNTTDVAVNYNTRGPFGQAQCLAAKTVYLAVNDYLEVDVYHVDGVARNVTGTIGETFWTIDRVED